MNTTLLHAPQTTHTYDDSELEALFHESPATTTVHAAVTTPLSAHGRATTRLEWPQDANMQTALFEFLARQ